MPDPDPPHPEPEKSADGMFLRTWLLDRDEPCPLCAYNLRGLVSDRCPECGNQLRLSVSLVEPYIRAWIALIAGVLLPAGFGVFIILGFLYALSREGLPSWRDIQRAPLGGMFLTAHVVLCVPASIAAIVGRRRFQRWSRTAQRSCAAGAWIAILISCLYLVSIL